MDFEIALFIALVVAGVVIYIDKLFGVPKRAGNTKRGSGEATLRMPILVEYSRSFFPVLLAVFLLRAFVVEPFRIPSG